jgi:hypothetical protein
VISSPDRDQVVIRLCELENYKSRGLAQLQGAQRKDPCDILHQISKARYRPLSNPGCGPRGQQCFRDNRLQCCQDGCELNWQGWNCALLEGCSDNLNFRDNLVGLRSGRSEGSSGISIRRTPPPALHVELARADVFERILSCIKLERLRT